MCVHVCVHVRPVRHCSSFVLALKEGCWRSSSEGSFSFNSANVEPLDDSVRMWTETVVEVLQHVHDRVAAWLCCAIRSVAVLCSRSGDIGTIGHILYRSVSVHCHHELVIVSASAPH